MASGFASFRSRGSLGSLVALALALGAGCVEQAEEKATAEDLAVIKQSILATAPTPQFPVNADLDGKAIYLGLDVSPNPIEPGKEAKLIHYWKVVSPLIGWRSFVHANGPNRQGFINFDHGPVRGKYPVAQWKAGEIIKDEHAIRLPPTWSHDKVEIYTGLWRGQERMTIKTGPKDETNRVLAAVIPVKAAQVAKPAIKRYVARKLAHPPKIDGKLDEWKDIPNVGTFVNTMTGAASQPQTEAKIAWDDKNIYFAFDNTDKSIWGKLNNRDDKLWTQEADEVMIDADGNGKTYIELQVSPSGALFDSYLPMYRKYEDLIDPKRKPYSWNSRAKWAVNIEGTLNKVGDEDKRWTTELALPLADVNGLDTVGAKIPPAFGDVWRINLYRMDSADEGKPQAAVGWSPPLVGDFHALDRFGEVLFGDEKGTVPPKAVPITAERKEAIKAALAGMPSPSGQPSNKLEVEHKSRAAKKTGKPGDTAKQ